MSQRPRLPETGDFKAGDWVAVSERATVGYKRGQVIGLADEGPMLLVRWYGGRVCDWVKAGELIHVDEAGDRARHKERGA